MELRAFWIFFLVIVVFLDVGYSSAVCASGHAIGADISIRSSNVDSGTGNTMLLEDQRSKDDYRFDCCGILTTWEYYATTNTGDVYFQVWRDVTSSPASLAGENRHIHSSPDGIYNFTVNTGDRIRVMHGDYIGLHFPVNSFVVYYNGHKYKITNGGYTTSSPTFDWTAISTLNNRDYAVKAYLEPSSLPPIINLNASVTFGPGTAVDTLIYTLVVTDPDANDVVTTTEISNTGSSMFVFNSTSLEIRTQAPVTAGIYTIDFSASDSSDSCALTSNGTLTITITNVPPTIHNLPATYSLSEDQTTQLLLITVNVTDPSETVTCSISSAVPNSNPFTFNADFSIYVNSNPGLSYNTVPEYVLTINCTDTYDHVSSNFTINLIPNLPPTINNLPATTSLLEDHNLEQLLHTLNATDPENETVTCSISDPVSSPFFIKPISGTSDLGIFVQYGPSFVYSVTSQYNLTVSCQDSRSIVNDSYTVSIIANQPPEFTNLDATVNISRLSTGIGDQVFRVAATDNETDELYYNMTSEPSSGCSFAIYSSGDIVTTSSLYTTSVTTCTLSIWVYDSKTLVGPQTLNVTVTGDNNVPSFSNLPTAIVLPENSAKGLSVYQINVTDIDTADNHTFTSSYNPIEGAKYFVVDTTTGLVSTSTQNINYEALNSTDFQITIYVSDSYDFIPETLNITINNVNEAPYFDKSYYAISGDEDLSSGVQTFPGFVVYDPDTDDTLAYTMDCGAYQANFSMNTSSGNVTLESGYDLDIGTNPSSVSCVVVVTDGEYNDTATLLITINQINDNTPQFNSQNYTFYVSSDIGIGTSFGSINATDGDISTHIYGTLSYSLNLSSSSCDCFAVTHNGELYVTQSLDSEADDTTFTFTASATDCGNKQDTTTINVIKNAQTGITTTATTTTTDRYITFLEDPRNPVWLVLVGCALLGFFILLVYFTYTLELLDDFCSECTHRLRNLCKPKPRKPSGRSSPLRIAERFRTTPTMDEPTPTPEPILFTRKQWQPWNPHDFKASDFR